MRYPGSEKLEIIRLVEQSHLPVRRAPQEQHNFRSPQSLIQNSGTRSIRSMRLKYGLHKIKSGRGKLALGRRLSGEPTSTPHYRCDWKA